MTIKVNLELIQEIGLSKATLYSYLKQKSNKKVAEMQKELGMGCTGIHQGIKVLEDLGCLKRHHISHKKVEYEFLR